MRGGGAESVPMPVRAKGRGMLPVLHSIMRGFLREGGGAVGAPSPFQDKGRGRSALLHSFGAGVERRGVGHMRVLPNYFRLN